MDNGASSCAWINVESKSKKISVIWGIKNRRLAKRLIRVKSLAFALKNRFSEFQPDASKITLASVKAVGLFFHLAEKADVANDRQEVRESPVY
jgi:hypothetical protein